MVEVGHQPRISCPTALLTGQFSRRHVLKDADGNPIQKKPVKLDEDMLAEDLEEMGAEAGSRLPQDRPKAELEEL